jgi:hypothetical protein
MTAMTIAVDPSGSSEIEIGANIASATTALICPCRAAYIAAVMPPRGKR